jgi:raffinose/stachyose/melibiose transport system substrate-binding protein
MSAIQPVHQEIRTMRNLVSRVPVVAVLAIIVSACTGGPVATGSAPASLAPAPTGASADPGTSPAAATGDLRFLVEQPEDPAVLEALDAHLDEFEAANPGITVELEAQPFDTLRTVLQTQLRSGDGPDVFSWGSGPAHGGALAEAGLLYDLTAAYEEHDWPVYEFAKDRVTFDGKTYGVPGEMETIGLFYNKDLFTELGIADPQNLADLDAAAQKVKAAGKVPMAVSDQEGWQGFHLLSMALSSRVGSDGMEALLNGETPWTSPDVVAALKLWEGYNSAGYLPPTPTAISYDNGNALFFSGDAAMLPTGSWLVAELEGTVDFAVGYVPFPSETGPGIFTAGLGSGPYISATTEHPEAAVKFVDFLVSPEHGRWTVENLNSIPAYPVDTAGVDVSPLFAQVLADTAKFAGGDGDSGHNIDVLSTEAFNDAMLNGIQGLLTGQKTAEQVAAELDAAYKQ